MVLYVSACSTAATKEEPPFAAEESMREADELMNDGYYEQAREVLETVKIKDSTRKYSELASLRIADTYYDEELYDEAVVEYEAFLDIHPYHKYASYAQYKLAMSFFSRIKTVDVSYSWAKRALNEFEKLQRAYPRNPYMNIIDNRIRACLNILAEYEFYVGNFYFKKGSFNAAIGRFDGMLKEYPGSTMVPDALYYKALAYENLGQREEALSHLTALVDKYPATEISIEAQKLIDSFDKKQ
jgi:outer membrane protein assembly factor BamD